ncbi:MAG: SDR family oxidoreductase [Alphaproteobacteria bacterium]|nr:SDR family oxidoreductase [Alphaproteobacteria bacterium]
MTSELGLNHALVTGATSGIGEATVRALVASGRTVLAVARRQDRLEALASETGCSWMAADVRETEKLADGIEAFAPDIVVNNAGVGHGSSGLEDLDAAMIQEAIDINVVAPIQITALALAGMRARARGHIVNIGSIAGLHTLVSAVYGGTKSAVHRFSQNLRVELRGSGIRVTELCPGRVSTEFYQAASGDRDRLDQMGQSGIRELLPDDIAAAILFAVNAPAHVNVATIEILPTEQAVGGVHATPVEAKS